MLQAQIEIQLVAALVAAACAIPGVFLVLRRSALVSDAISHTVLFGIVIGYLLIRDTTSPLLILFAAASGLLMVTLSELLLRTRRVREDAAIGVVFPALFSIAVLIITQNLQDVHIDTDTVLLGQLAFAPFNRVMIFGVSLPMGVVVMGSIFLLNLMLLILFYKELKLATFDAALAAAFGFAPALIQYGLMASVSITAVGAFDHVGAILVVALMIAPPATAYLLTNRLSFMILYSVLIAVASAILGYWTARALNIEVAGTMAGFTGVFFLLALVFAPSQGLIARRLEHLRRRETFAVDMLLVHLKRHEHTDREQIENTISHLTSELNWSAQLASKAVTNAKQKGWITLNEQLLRLTDSGRSKAQIILSI